jgi:acetyl-CoA carboxylase alpha subunit
MDSNSECLLIKYREYQELLDKVNSKRPDIIRVNIFVDGPDLLGRDVESTVNLSNGLHKQLHNIVDNIKSTFNKQLKELRQEHENELSENAEIARESSFREIANMSWRERRKFLKEYKY